MRAELVASQTRVEQLECQLKQTSSETKQRDTELKLAIASRDEALRENERLSAELEHCHSNHAREVHTHTVWCNSRFFICSKPVHVLRTLHFQSYDLDICLQCLDTVGWSSGRVSGL